ncbi:unnamed protein product [Caenorhabditis auriculariae]|uniref:tetrahydrofolate synthase n=1 Tax=Caenorhabditis auriculariae TaxID=2777116 RepID=A0A8S1H172_9PELO|nr:unnamed protein product [Caenorhabditis auriculariae]
MLFRLFQQQLARRPLATQMAVTGVISGAGDLFAQYISGEKEWDKWRTARFFAVQTFFVAPSLSVWFRVLERVKSSNLKLLPLKRVFVDQLTFIKESKDRMTRDWWTIYSNSLKLWPAVQLINFYFMPLNYRVILVQSVAFFWNTYLSFATQQSKTAPPAQIELGNPATTEQRTVKDKSDETRFLQQRLIDCGMQCGGTIAKYSRIVGGFRVNIAKQMTTAVDDTPHSKYEKAVLLLNGLQSNAEVIKKMREQRDQVQNENIPESRRFLKSLNISNNDLNSLNVIHVSGTKGKGSTCAFIEQILRDFGLKTGLYTSPHLIHVRERIRINGAPISEESFAEQFFFVYNKLKEENKDSMPAYFKFLTLMAFHVFLKEKTDVVILEVGIGGEHDCTNVIEKPVTCGITTLDHDHTSILGQELTGIAWHKAGILKKNAVAVFSPTVEAAEKVIRQRSAERETTVVEAPPLEAYQWPRDVTAGIAGRHQALNMSLALQLSRIWLSKQRENQSSSLFMKSDWSPGTGYQVPASFCDALESCHWPGRSQVLQTDRIKFLIDGAHTPKSMEACADWAREAFSCNDSDSGKYLLFQCTADRNPASLLECLKAYKFEKVLFCPTQLSVSTKKTSDSANFNQPGGQQLEKAKLCSEAWRSLTGEDALLFDCVSSAMDWLEDQSKEKKLAVLVTGSLHLVGSVLNVVTSKYNVSP